MLILRKQTTCTKNPDSANADGPHQSQRGIGTGDLRIDDGLYVYVRLLLLNHKS